MGKEERTRDLSRTARGELIAVYALCVLLVVILGISYLRQRGVFRSTPVVEHHPGKRPMQPIDLNVAEAWELQLLPGIGEKRAQKIIELREKKKRFASIDELTEVRGITDKIVDELREYVRVGTSEASK